MEVRAPALDTERLTSTLIEAHRQLAEPDALPWVLVLLVTPATDWAVRLCEWVPCGAMVTWVAWATRADDATVCSLWVPM